MTKGKPFSGKLKKQQLQAKREKKAQKELHAEAKYNAERDALAGLASSAPPQPVGPPPIEYMSTDVGFSGDLRTIFAKEPQAAIDARKKDATRALVMADDRGNSQSIYAYGLTDVRNQPPIPIRPHWSKHTSPDELAMAEEDAFREWLLQLHQTCVERRQQAVPTAPSICSIPGSGVNTWEINSYERNLQVWRQLWRVIEKANVLVHLADSRCPLLHLSHRLIQHIQDDHPTKRVLILLTKCDFVAPERVDLWVKYIRDRYNVPVLTYSRDRVDESNTFLLTTIGRLSEDTSYKKGRDEDLNAGTLMVGLVRPYEHARERLLWLCECHCFMVQGFHSKGGKLDVFRAANLLLRDTLNGKKVILSFPPPLEGAATVVGKGDEEHADKAEGGAVMTTDQVAVLLGDMDMQQDKQIYESTEKE
ncbi:hypothetical protein DYB35_007909 [Aphanomyces astaci]|uniref:Guanine nucleotide-binding protein-like 3 N-terminal domain-containing protein n=1 Tax=Aphanomyces astaci TaxID=112090 RepID=A0A418D4J3_APHAT|nr:hypothetical protein DYB35_007909 [Aphanomyces astaci]